MLQRITIAEVITMIGPAELEDIRLDLEADERERRSKLKAERYALNGNLPHGPTSPELSSFALNPTLTAAERIAEHVTEH